MREHIELRVFRSLVGAAYGQTEDGAVRASDPDSLFDRFGFTVREQSHSVPDFAVRYLLANFLKKWQGWKTSANLANYTREVWENTERHVFCTNQRLKELSPFYLIPHGNAERMLISSIRKKVIRMIGYEPPKSWLDEVDWPTGATLDTKMGTTVGEKVCKSNITTTSSAYPYAALVFGDFGHVDVRSNRQEAVPKTYKVHRIIACEPTVNAMLQKGVGRTIRKLVKRRCGINIRKQAAQNRDLAYLARSCSLSTIDLESASDTIASAFVHLVVPPSWFRLLDDLRTRSTLSNGRRIYLEKFASMGNGYIFELETVLFRAVVEAVYELCNCSDDGSIAVFGDDIIVKREMYDPVCNALAWCGFIVNKEKSFKDGLFFESCGHHYYNDCLVTPAFQKKVVGRSAFELIAMHNRLYRWAQRTGMWTVVRDALKLIKSEYRVLYPRYAKVPRQPPLSEGDLGFISQSGGWYVDRNGDYILSLALVRRQPAASLVIHHAFYLSNALRCGNSFYANPRGWLELPTDGFYTVRKNYKLWRSGTESPRGELVVSRVKCPEG
ncbi:TPA_asm: RNA-directed RNA polymerase [ssRNA phage SRR7976325_14]|uniref:RNA-directed RNA polymerase n=1 Tax=ssRNA phage SRR7976325_14 TaxID=2786701 RepID=A0A8S5L5N5_9VIRU|nr:RNA-directed RNA polymerase [ssRNA phage SRR7976325_14]DAD52773.1 TPA_asm: RNA-directed RNA polymerase [ssRNA phage SRR7976325_14]